MSMLRRSASALSALVATAFSVAAQADNQSPTPSRAISIDGGYAIQLGTGGPDKGFYRVVWEGRSLREHGVPFKYARALDLLAPALDRAGGDVPAIAFRYENDRASANGGLLEALGASELPLPGLSQLGLRGVARIGADADFKQITGAVGLETPPVRLPGLANSGVSNWLVFGINAERREATDSGPADGNVALATFRGFVGKALGWRKSADVGRTAGKLVRDLLELAPTRAAAITLRARIDSIPANQRTSLQQTLLDGIPEAASDEDWVRTVEEMAFGEADAITDQPTAALYAEGSGWVDFGSDPAGGRFKSLLTASLDYWFLPTRDDVLLRLRYEFGYERAEPGIKKNRLLVTIGVRL
ncbi:MAG: hypothetical protein ACKVZ0_17160 [Gemmatimonadales bacterium]